MTRGRPQRSGEANRKRRLLKKTVTAAVRRRTDVRKAVATVGETFVDSMAEAFTDTAERMMWMLRVKDCHHICLFCEYYEKCGLNRIPEGGDRGKMNMKYAKKSEDTEQISVMNWAHWHTGEYPALKWLHHIPNGGSRNQLEAKKLKEMGVKPGVADLFLPCPKGCYHGMYIEMKFGNNRHTDRQKEFLADMAETGYFVVTCYSYEDAKRMLKEYVSLPMPEVLRNRVSNGAGEMIVWQASWTRDEHKMGIPNNSILKDGKVK